jgi:hypothetical protein
MKVCDQPFSKFILFSQQQDLASTSKSKSGADLNVDPMVRLSYLRVSLRRLRPGMSVYAIHVSINSEGGQPIAVVIKGDRNFSKLDSLNRLWATVFKEFKQRGSTVYKWESIDPAPLAKSTLPYFRNFSSLINTTTLEFVTDALI